MQQGGAAWLLRWHKIRTHRTPVTTPGQCASTSAMQLSDP